MGGTICALTRDQIAPSRLSLQMEADDFLQAGAEGRVDAAEVDALIQARLNARANKDWAESDRIRDQLTAVGVVLEDGKGGTTWRLAD